MSRPLLTDAVPAGPATQHFPEPAIAGEALDAIPESHRRDVPMALPAFDEATLLEHFRDAALCCAGHGESSAAIARAEAMPALSRFHPRQPLSTVQGLLEVAHEAARALAALTGLDRFSLQPPSVAAARRGALQVARAAFLRTQPERVEVVLAGGVAADEAADLGLTVCRVPRLASGDLDVDAMMEAAGPATAAVVASWLTPAGHFERNLLAAGEVAHASGALFAVDATGLRALAGRTRLREAEADVCWLGLSELSAAATSGAIGVRTALTEFLPSPIIGKTRSGYELDDELPGTIGPLASGPAHMADALGLYVGLLSLGAEGLRARGERTVVAANACPPDRAVPERRLRLSCP